MTGAYVDIDRPSFGVRDEAGADGEGVALGELLRTWPLWPNAVPR